MLVLRGVKPVRTSAGLGYALASQLAVPSWGWAGLDVVRVGRKVVEAGDGKALDPPGKGGGRMFECRGRTRSFSRSLWSCRNVANDAWKLATTSMSRSKPSEDEPIESFGFG